MTDGVAEQDNKTKARPNGSRNLIILGVGAIALTIITTSLSLMLYRTSGDIYLDRSRPGFLPDEEEAATEDPLPETTYSFSDTGNLTREDLELYSTELDQLITELRKYDDVYDPDTLSDTSLGIPSELETE